MDQKTLTDKISGCLLGMAIGDAMGRPANGLSPYDVLRRYQVIDGFYSPDPSDKKGEKAGKYGELTRLGLILAGKLSAKGTDKDVILAAHQEALPMLPASWVGPISAAQRDLQSDHGLSSLDPDLVPKMIPLGAWAARVPVMSDEDLLRACKAVAWPTHSSRPAILMGWMVAKAIREVIRNGDALSDRADLYEGDKSLLARMVGFCQRVEAGFKSHEVLDDRLSFRLEYVRMSLQAGKRTEELVGTFGNSRDVLEVVGFSLFCALKQPDDFQAICVAASKGGRASVNASLVGAICGAYVGTALFPKGMIEGVHNSARILALAESMATR